MPQSKQSTTTTSTDESKVLSPEQKAELEKARQEHKERNAKAETVTFHAKDGSESKVNVHRRLKTSLEIVREIDDKKFVETYPAAADTKDVFEAIRVSTHPFEVKTAKAAPSASDKVTKTHCGNALTAVRKELTAAWKAIDAGNADEYIAAVNRATVANGEAVKLAERFKAQSAPQQPAKEETAK